MKNEQICEYCDHSYDRDYVSNTCPFEGTAECDIEKDKKLQPIKARKWKWVMMPVKVLGKGCNNCPCLKIDTEVFQELGDKGETLFETTLQCRNVQRCIRISQMIDRGEI